MWHEMSERHVMTRTLDTLSRQRARFACWIAQPHRPYALWFGKHGVVVAWLGLLTAVLSPPQGLGVALCSFHNATGLPCPGCGVMRSLSCGIRGMLLESWHYHPLGLLVLGLFVITVWQSLWPASWRARLAQRMQEHAGLWGALYLGFVGTFVAFGIIRALVSAASWI